MLSCICMTVCNQVLHCKLNLAFSAICKVTTSKFTGTVTFVPFRKLHQTHFCGHYRQSKYFWQGCFVRLACCAMGQLPPSAPLSYANELLFFCQCSMADAATATFVMLDSNFTFTLVNDDPLMNYPCNSCRLCTGNGHLFRMSIKCTMIHQLMPQSSLTAS